jgi:hypothetical protein
MMDRLISEIDFSVDDAAAGAGDPEEWLAADRGSQQDAKAVTG